MEELELLKKDWQKGKTDDFPKLTKGDIYKLLLKKSSTSVKWIFIVSVIEFFVSIVGVIAYKFFKSENDPYQKLDMVSEVMLLEVVSFVILIYFMYRFFTYYRSISATESAKALMENIMKTRKTVRLYITIMLGISAVFLVYFLIVSMLSTPDIQDLLTEKINAGDSTFGIYTLVVGISLLLTAFLIGLAALLYFLFYGLFLRKLKRNYKELKQLDF